MSNYNKPIPKSDYAFIILLLTLVFFLISYTYLDIQERYRLSNQILSDKSCFVTERNSHYNGFERYTLLTYNCNGAIYRLDFDILRYNQLDYNIHYICREISNNQCTKYIT